MITDGQSTQREKLISIATSLRDSGVKIIAVGVGDKVGEGELNIIAGNSLNVFNVSNAGSLNKYVGGF